MRTFSYIFLLLITGIGALFSQVNYSYVPFLIVCSWALIAVVYRGYLKSIQLTVKESLNGKIEIRCKQKWRLPFQLQYEATYEHFISKETSIIRGSFFTNERIHLESLHLSSPYCGQLVLKKLQVIYCDLLKLTVFKTVYEQPCRVFQMPKLRQMELVASASSPTLITGTEAGAKERFASYMPGDSVSSIHWAMSARTQTLIVRKEAFAAQSSLHGIALHFNDIVTVEDYNQRMTDYYTILRQQHFTTAYVWEQGWAVYHITNLNELNQLFQKLFLVPIQQLYAEAPPPANAIFLPIEGGY